MYFQDAFKAGQQFAKELTKQVSSFESTCENPNRVEVPFTASGNANTQLQPIQSNEPATAFISDASTAAIQSPLLSMQSDNAAGNIDKCDNYSNLESNGDVTTAIELSPNVCDPNSSSKAEIVKTETTNNLLNLIVRLTRASINFNVLAKSKEELNELKQNGEIYFLNFIWENSFDSYYAVWLDKIGYLIDRLPLN